MDKINWNEAPEWADSVRKTVAGGFFWCDDKQYLILGHSKESNPISIGSKDQTGIARYYTIDDLELVEMRPDKWQEGEERMNNIGPNGNEGEHYEAGDIDISEAVRLQNEAHDKRVLYSIKNSPDYEVVGSSHDNVNHPEHYQSESGIECIDAIRASLGLDGFVAYCRGNAIKYAWRSGKKANHAEDLRKAAWYLEKAASELDK